VSLIAAMRYRIARAAPLVLLLAVVAYVAGPRPPPLRLEQAAALPADLDAYLRERESRHPDLRPDAAAHIRWFGGARGQRTALGLVYVHGFSASHRETHPFAERLADRLGANLYQLRLRGHGRSPSGMGEASANDWLDDLSEARAIARRIGDRSLLIGTSQGGALALLSAVADPADLVAVVVVSPNFGVADPAASLLSGPWGEHIARLVIGADEHSFVPVNAEHARHWTTRYPLRALVAMQQVVDALQAAPLDRLNTPVLAYYSRRDRVVDPEALRQGIARVGSRHVWLLRLDEAADPQGHVLVGDILSPNMTSAAVETTLAFLQHAGVVVEAQPPEAYRAAPATGARPALRPPHGAAVTGKGDPHRTRLTPG
jgi:alpha-beta hydrolase superfamily lysophospholipase